MCKELLTELKRMKGIVWLIVSTSVVMLLSYGYQITHSTIGIDDTAIGEYFIDGWAPQVGRWTIFVLNKLFYVADFTPYMTDLLGLIFLLLFVLTIVALWNIASCGKIGMASYCIFSCIFVSSPFIGEVYIYYLHNAVGLGFFLTALSVLLTWESLRLNKKRYIICAALLLSLAIGAYETFALVYLFLIAATYFIHFLFGERKKANFKTLLKSLLFWLIPPVTAVAMRTAVCRIIAATLGIELKARTASAMQYWFKNDAWVILKDLIYRFILRYILNAQFIFAVAVFLASALLFVVLVATLTICQKRWVLLVTGILMMCIPWLLVPVELSITPYRASQTLMVFAGFVWMLFANIIFYTKWNKCIQPIKKTAQAVAIIAIAIIIFNQSYQLNKFFYFDVLKEENDESVCRTVAVDIMREYSTDKPVVFVGGYKMPKAYRDWVYLSKDSNAYIEFSRPFHIGNTKAFLYYEDDEFGYQIYEVACMDPLYWTSWATGTGEESQIYNYMEMLGYTFKKASEEQYKAVAEQAEQMPIYPQTGYISEEESCIIVHMGDQYLY